MVAFVHCLYIKCVYIVGDIKAAHIDSRLCILVASGIFCVCPVTACRPIVQLRSAHNATEALHFLR